MIPAVSVKNISKTFRYRVEMRRSVKSSLVELFTGKSEALKTINVLNDVSFDIMPGEFVGVMGRNGEGKSTLLKIICGVYEPTAGTIETHGKIAPLTNLGAGFKGELSGLENIYLNAAIIGYGRQAVKERLQEIIDFAELGDKIHMPTKNYSSGMLMRLGFSIATHLAAPIIVLDEILGVGDANFLKKSQAKILELHRSGRTILLVTHSAAEVAKFCTRCVVIKKGYKIFDGHPVEGAKEYLRANDMAQEADKEFQDYINTMSDTIAINNLVSP